MAVAAVFDHMLDRARTQVAAHVADFVAAPTGQFITGPTYVYGLPDARLSVVLVWGHPSHGDLERLLLAYEVELRPGEPHDSLVDTSGLTEQSPSSLERVAEALRSRAGALQRQIRRQALVRPAGTFGSFVSALYGMAQPVYSTAVFAQRRAALEWLGCTAASDSLDALEARERGDLLLLRLRRFLVENGRAPRLRDAADMLAMEPRKLQRRLRDRGTSFRDEVARVLIERAQVLLRDPDIALRSVARELGLSSAQNFATLYRRITGVSPSQWRAGHQS